MKRRVIALAAVLALAGGAVSGVAAFAQPAGAPPGTAQEMKATRSAWFKHQPWQTNLPEVKKTGSGLEYVVIASGPATGVSPKVNQAAQIWYEGRLNSGGGEMLVVGGRQIAQDRRAAVAGQGLDPPTVCSGPGQKLGPAPPE